MPLVEVMQNLEWSQLTYQRSSSQVRMIRLHSVAQLKTVEQENARLKRLDANDLDCDILRMVTMGK
jgi:hypothetical protein